MKDRDSSTHREVDKVTGVETTGHEWDGVKELNKPLPAWWLYTFYATIIWAIGYWVVYPAFPTLTSYTRGVLGYSQRAVVAEDVKKAQAAQSGMRALLANTELKGVRQNPELLRFAMAAGATSFQTNCAPCHGRGAQGSTGYPNLNDDDWLWGGDIEAIHKTIQFGIRSGHPQARDSAMPRYGADGLLKPAEIEDLAEYVLSLSSPGGDPAVISRGEKLFKEQCVGCHGDNGRGNIEFGAPNLADNIWLYGGTKAAVLESIRTGRGGAMPAWVDRLDPITVKALAIYVHSLGGGR